MKKGKGSKTQIALAVMVVALAAAVGLNMKYSADQGKGVNNSSKYLGQAEYVNAEVSSQQDDKAQEKDYFVKLRDDRNKAREEALDIIEETLDRTDLSGEEKKNAANKAAALATAAEQESAIETVLKAKGFSSVVAVIGEKDINIIIEGTSDAQKIAQIQDTVLSKTSFTAADIKIISASDN